MPRPSTHVTIVQEVVPAVIPPEMCDVGWQESLTLRALLVEPEIPDGPWNGGRDARRYPFPLIGGGTTTWGGRTRVN